MLSRNSNFNLKYHWSTNPYILEIIANILMSYISFKYVETYTVKANIVVSSLLIGCNFFLFVWMRRNNIFSTGLMPFIFSRIKNVFMVIGVFFLLCLKSFLLLRYASMVDLTISMINDPRYLIENQLMSVTDEQPSMRFLYSKAIIIGSIVMAVFFVQCKYYYKKIKEKEIKEKIDLLIENFVLDRKTTKFFVDGSVEAFKVNGYLYFINLGLMIDDRIYNKNTVIDYCNITGIGFKDLDNGHVTNIKMYAV